MIIRNMESITTSDGSAEYEIELCDGQSFAIQDLPEGAKYTVTEEAEKHYIAGFEVFANDGAVIANSAAVNHTVNTSLSTVEERVDGNDKDVIFKFTNTYNASDYVLPAAGVSDIRYLILLFFSGTVIFAVLYLFVNRTGRKHIK